MRHFPLVCERKTLATNEATSTRAPCPRHALPRKGVDYIDLLLRERPLARNAVLGTMLEVDLLKHAPVGG
jgi:hypothetical protein